MPSTTIRIVLLGEPRGTFQPGIRVPIIDTGLDGWFSQLGDAPGVHFATVMMAGMLAFGSLFVYAFRQKPWYESTVIDLGEGRLPPS